LILIKPVRVFYILLGLWLSISFFQGVKSEAASPTYSIKFATVAPDGSTWIEYMRKLNQDIQKKSNGRLGFRIFSGAVVGDELDVLKRMRVGQIHCAAFSGVGFGQILPMVRVLDLPFMFRNDKEIDLVQNKMFNFFSDEFRKKGFELLAWAEVGNAHLFSKQPIRTVSDLSGLKIWTWSGDPIAKETFAAMGINPIPLAITDVTTSLNTGMIDTIYAPPLGALALQWHTNMKYMTALPLAHSTGAILISTRYFKKLPDDLKEMLQKSFKDAMSKLTDKLREQNKEASKLIEESGLQIIPIPEGDKLNEFYSIHNVVAQKLKNKLYPDEVLEQVYKILKR
jgi:TRAP-type C4-dicarboxylate transport system substrate-binding protein